MQRKLLAITLKDNVPVKTARERTNWSTGRSTEVGGHEPKCLTISRRKEQPAVLGPSNRKEMKMATIEEVKKSCRFELRWERMTHSVIEGLSQDQWTDRRTDGHTDGRTSPQTDGHTDGLAHERTNMRTDGRTSPRTDGRTSERKNEWSEWMMLYFALQETWKLLVSYVLWTVKFTNLCLNDSKLRESKAKRPLQFYEREKHQLRGQEYNKGDSLLCSDRP